MDVSSNGKAGGPLSLNFHGQVPDFPFKDARAGAENPESSPRVSSELHTSL